MCCTYTILPDNGFVKFMEKKKSEFCCCADLSLLGTVSSTGTVCHMTKSLVNYAGKNVRNGLWIFERQNLDERRL